MHAKDKFGYFDDDQVQVLRMNYTGGDAFMMHCQKTPMAWIML